MPLRIVRRRDTGALVISGIIRYPDGQRARIRRRSQSDDPALAREEAAIIEAQLLRDAWHGERRGARTFAQAVTSYMQAAPRSDPRRATIGRLVRVLGRLPLSAIDQDALVRARSIVLRPTSSPATFARQVIGPVSAVLNHAHRRGWCDPPHFDRPRGTQGRTSYLLPAEAERLIEAAAPHLQPLLVFLLCTGARMSEALGLDWRDVDLQAGRCIFWAAETKSGRRRVVRLPPRATVSMANLPRSGMHAGMVGRVFLAPGGAPYTTSRERGYGGQIKTGWRSAIRRAFDNQGPTSDGGPADMRPWGVEPGPPPANAPKPVIPGRAGGRPALTPHCLRHTWASWHYALYRDPLWLREEGGWSSLALVERYAHLLPAGQESAIRGFWGENNAAAERRA